MSGIIKISKLNHATIKIDCSLDIAMEISETFRFEVPGAKFMPSYKNGTFDGFIRLFNMGSRTMASGLFTNMVEFANNRGYSYSVEETEYGVPGQQTELVTREVIKEYMESLNLRGGGDVLDIRDYQIEAVYRAILDKQLILHSSVGSGKSMMIYCICRYLTEELGIRVLIIVPTVGLTTQMRADFRDYSSANGYKTDDNVHLISAGISNITKKPIVISTFQSLKTATNVWFNLFGCIFTDEGHSITAQSFQEIYGKATEVPYRLACTGTLHETKCNMLVMQGITGPVVKIATAADLIAAGQLVPMKVKGININYPSDVCKAFAKVPYEDEINWLTIHPQRNKFLMKLAAKCTGTTILFFRFVDHGKLLYNGIKELVGDSRNVYFISGDVSKEDRETIRLVANQEDAIIVASYGCMKQGVNLPAIENIIIGHPIKGGITYGQSLGRGLRLKKGKTFCNLFDVGDNLSWKSKVNHTFRHFGTRMETLTREGYDFTIVNVNMNN